MSEVETIVADERRRRAEARLAASRLTREAVGAAHARAIVFSDEGGLVRKSLAEIAANPYRMTEEEIEAAASVDPDNTLRTDAELEQVGGKMILSRQSVWIE